MLNSRYRFSIAFGLLFCFMAQWGAAQNGSVKIWEEPLVLPTYLTGEDDVNPMFRKPLSYQGASKVIYPYPLQESLSNQKEEQTYNALYLENEYIKLCVLPEMGGRLFYATDKTNGYELFYRQHVIKPSQIGMLGAWVSGGIEWCVFHHHRASTFMPMNYRLVENNDGSKTIWFGEIEPRHRMKWSIGISLFPGSSRIEAKIRMYNRTDTTNSILYWANVATHVNDDYQVFFPPSTEYGVYHSKNEFVHWPIGRTRYRGVDYDGVDLSWWKNHPNPVSIFAHDLKEGFLGGYDHGQDAGVVHVANPHIVKGAKLWEWGPGPEGSMWDTQVLTDADGPYAELMAGAYSDNQPDYSWIKPYEVKEAVQTWYPLREIGGVKSANQHAAVNLEVNSDNQIHLRINTTEHHRDVMLSLRISGKNIRYKPIDVSPAKPFKEIIEMPQGAKEEDIVVSLITQGGQKLVEYSPVKLDVPDERPKTVEPPQDPDKIESVEELYLTGLRIKQFHNARLDPTEYFKEALKRDPLDSRSNIQMGLDAARRGIYEEAEAYFSKAVERISKNYTRPRDCEAYYQLGLVQQKQGKLDDAYENLYRAVWDYEFRGAAYFNLAQIESLRGNYAEALALIDQSLEVNTLNTKALGLKSALQRQLKQPRRAVRSTERALRIDPLDFLAWNERALARRGDQQASQSDQVELARILKDDPESYLELAQDYMNAGLSDDAEKILTLAVDSEVEGLSDYPTVHYTLAFLSHLSGNEKKAIQQLELARKSPTDYCFPYRLETIRVLQFAIETNPQDSRAYYYLGNLLFDLQPIQAIEMWRKAVQYESALAIAHRNLGWAYYDVNRDFGQAIASYETAIQHNPLDPRYYYELDKLYEGNLAPVETRIQILEANHEVVAKNESALTRAIIALVQGEQYDKAIQYLDDYYFHIQEGNRRLHDTYTDAHMLRGVERYKQGEFAKALEDFLAADEYPENHQMGRNRNYDRDPQIFYYTGLAYQALGDEQKTEAYFNKSLATNIREPRQYSYYQGLANRALGDEENASKCFDEMIEAGEKTLGSSEDVDFFAKFGEGESPSMRESNALYLMALGYLGKGNHEKAKEALEQVVGRDIYNNWARFYLSEI
ncbi:MAG: DUF5107 domain-containing protein [Candidatus Hinthialibacter antarcticus]|nr:DUF5107 domain-containing protein [Candidatus Hinthialibacter antarcticus]